MNTLPSAKANSPAEASDSILVSFEARWEELFISGQVSGFIRKRLPRTTSPKWIYAYFGTPLARISVKAQIKSISEVPIGQVIASASDLCISKEEIREYCAGLSSIGLCLIATPFVSNHKLGLERMRSTLSFFPPQSFLILSKDAKRIIESIGQFR